MEKRRHRFVVLGAFHVEIMMMMMMLVMIMMILILFHRARWLW